MSLFLFTALEFSAPVVCQAPVRWVADDSSEIVCVVLAA